MPEVRRGLCHRARSLLARNLTPEQRRKQRQQGPANSRYVPASWRPDGVRTSCRTGRARWGASHSSKPLKERSAMELGKLGVWIGMDGIRAAQAVSFARRVEQWGYGALWIPESRGRNALVHSSWLLSHTERLI